MLALSGFGTIEKIHIISFSHTTETWNKTINLYYVAILFSTQDKINHNESIIHIIWIKFVFYEKKSYANVVLFFIYLSKNNLFFVVIVNLSY